MANLLRTLLLIGLGAAELTEERVEAALDELVTRGELAEHEARVLASRWRRQREREADVERLEVLRGALDREVASLAELRALEARVDSIDRRVRDLQPVAD